jgi:hypothetical protein
VSPCNYKDYPPNWKQIVQEQKDRAGNICELCQAPNGAKVYRAQNGMWFVPGIDEADEDLGKLIIIVLTVHHIDGDKTNNVYPNLIVLCQRCHLRLDFGNHIKNAKKTRLAKTLKNISKKSILSKRSSNGENSKTNQDSICQHGFGLVRRSYRSSCNEQDSKLKRRSDASEHSVENSESSSPGLPFQNKKSKINLFFFIVNLTFYKQVVKLTT